MKQVYVKCKEHTQDLKESFCGAVKNILLKLKLDHLWVSEAIGDLKTWTSRVIAAVPMKDTKLWLKALEEKPKLRLYKCLKSDLIREEFLDWQIPKVHLSLYARLRSGTHQLRIETGRWVDEKEEERLCGVCITGKVESEAHFLTECYVYKNLREGMFRNIKQQTGYDLAVMRDNSE